MKPEQLPTTYQSISLKSGRVELVSLPFPKNNLGSNFVAIKPKYMGICRADVKEVTASRDIPEDRGPLFGHEFVGTVEFSGNDTGFSVGQTIAFNPNVTPNRTTGFAEYFFINGDKETLLQALTSIPDEVSIDPPWLPEPFACIVHSIDVLMQHLNRENFKDIKVGIIGAGNSGLMFGMLLKHYGAAITLLNRGQMRRQYAIDAKLFYQNEIASLSAYQQFQDAFDIVVLVPAAINEDVLDKGVAVVRDRGTILLYGGTRKGDRLFNTSVDIDTVRRSESIDSTEVRGKQIHLSGAYGCSRADFVKAIAFYKDHRQSFPLERIVSKTIFLGDLPQIITSMASGEKDYPGKILVKLGHNL